MKKLLSIAIVLCIAIGLTAAAFASGEASAEEAGAPIVLIGEVGDYSDAAAFMTPKLTDAIAPDGELDATRPLTRAEFCWMFNRMMGISASDEPSYSDIPSDAYYLNAVGFLDHFGVVTGKEDGTFRPDELITREEAFAIIANFFTSFENVQLVDSSEKDYFTRYTDAEDIAPENRDKLATMVLGDVAYSPTSELRPGDVITVIEAMDLLYRANEAKSAGSNFGEKDIPGKYKENMTAVIYVEHGTLDAASSEMKTVDMYNVTDTAADGLALEVTGDNRNAVLALGSETDFSVTNAEIESWSDSHGDGNAAASNGDNYGTGSIVCAGAGATVTVRDSRLIQHGVGSNTATATVNGTVNLYDCYLETTDTGSRALNTTNNSAMNLYRCEVVAAGWGALSTDTSAGNVQVYAEDSSFTVTDGRYAAYSDGGCMLTLVNCTLHSNADGVVCTGTGSLDFTDVDLVASDAEGAENYAVRVTNVQSDASEVACLDFTGGSIRNLGGAVFTVHSANAQVNVIGTELYSETGVLIDVSENLWMNYPVPAPADAPMNGVNFFFTDVEAAGDVIFSDPHHDMTITLDNSVISGDVIVGDTTHTLTIYLVNGGRILGEIPENVAVVEGVPGGAGSEALVFENEEIRDICAVMEQQGADAAAVFGGTLTAASGEPVIRGSESAEITLVGVECQANPAGNAIETVESSEAALSVDLWDTRLVGNITAAAGTSITLNLYDGGMIAGDIFGDGDVTVNVWDGGDLHDFGGYPTAEMGQSPAAPNSGDFIS